MVGKKIKLKQMDIYECIAIAKERKNMDNKPHKYAGNEKFWDAVDLVALGVKLGMGAARSLEKEGFPKRVAINEITMKEVYDEVRDNMNFQYEDVGRESGVTEDDHKECEEVLKSLLEEGLKSEVERPLGVMLEILGK